MRTTARKVPRQQRARATLDAITQAAAQVFREVGFQGASTNQIAEVAGVSIGSLYQYFPDKHAIAQALTVQIEDAWSENFAHTVNRIAHAPIADAVRALVAGCLDGYERDARLVHVLLTIPTHAGVPFVPSAPPVVVESIRALIELRRKELPDVDLDVAPALLARAVDAVTYGAILDGVPRKKLEPELVRMCLGYLGVRSARQD